MDFKEINKEKYANVILSGFNLLESELGYRQNTVVSKLKSLGQKISNSSFNLIIKGKQVGYSTLKQTAEKIERIVFDELGYRYNHEDGRYESAKSEAWRALQVPEFINPTHQIIFHQEGRVSLKEKTDFITSATQEVIEVGVRLNSLSNYFYSQNESNYKNYIVQILKRGLSFKGYLLDPESQEARMYFDDRAKIQTFERESITDIKKVIRRLELIGEELNSMNLSGRFEIYQYRHIPVQMFYVVDGATEYGKMMVSPYLFGIRRANCPVIEFNKKDHPSLFRKYWESLQLFTNGAKQIV